MTRGDKIVATVVGLLLGCAFWLAVAHAALGEMDKAFEYIAQAREDRDPNLLYMSAVPRVIGWQPDPRYRRTMQAIGLGHLV